MPSDMLTSALAIYDSTADKVTFLDFVKDNMPVSYTHLDVYKRQV